MIRWARFLLLVALRWILAALFRVGVLVFIAAIEVPGDE